MTKPHCLCHCWDEKKRRRKGLRSRDLRDELSVTGRPHFPGSPPLPTSAKLGTEPLTHWPLEDVLDSRSISCPDGNVLAPSHSQITSTRAMAERQSLE